MPLTPLLLAAALLIWPGNQARRRLRALTPSRAAPRRLPRIPVGVVAPAIAVWLFLGPAGALAAALLTAVIRSTVLRRRATRTHLNSLDAIAESLRSLVAELRAGTNPVIAAETAASDAPDDVAALLRASARSTRMGGDPDVPRDSTGAQIVRAWHLSTRHGLPLADVLDATRRDLEQRARSTRQTDARMAGPRASAGVLAALPVVALLLGHSTGAQPLTVLADTALGQFLLVLGTCLAAAGLRWSDHITQVRPL